MVELEDAGDTLARVQFGPWEIISLDIGIRMGLLEHMVGDKSPSTPSELALRCQSEVLLTERVLRCLASYNAVSVHEVNEKTYYRANAVTAVYASSRGKLHMHWCQNVLHPGWLNVASKLEQNGFQSIRSAKNSVHSELRGQPDRVLWEILTDKERETCQNFMPAFNREHLDWFTVYPVEHNLLTGSENSPDSVLFVDVGGNTGSQAIAFAQAFPGASGRIICQDREPVISSLASHDKVEFMAQDFFEPQAVQGARVYYLRYIMHDWSDEYNTKILFNLRNAMRPKYSKLIINDWSLPKSGASAFMTSMDLTMMGTLGGIERTLEQHESYILAAGLRITGVWDPEDGRSESVIECMVA